MADAFDRIVIDVPDLASAVAEYSALLGHSAHTVASRRAWFVLSNTTIELCAQTPHEADLVEDVPVQAQISGLVLRDPRTAEAVSSVPNSLDLALGLCDGSSTEQLRASAATVVSVDHLVLRTDSAQSCVQLFNSELGVRLALDKTVPEWGGRMLFFRAGKMTLEVIEAAKTVLDSDLNSTANNPVERTAGRSFFWGIAYQYPDLEAACAQATARGVSFSSVREGRKPGTRVATVKSHCLGIPTLFIQPAG